MRKNFTPILLALTLTACTGKLNNENGQENVNPTPTLSISGLPASYSCDRGYYPFTVSSNVEIKSEVTEGNEWLKCGNDNTKAELINYRLALELYDNETTAERKGKVVFYAPDHTFLKEIEIIQPGQPEGFITFADEVVELVCLKRYDKNSDGKLSLYETKQVWTIPEDFFGDTYNKAVISFDELEQFPNVEGIGTRAFTGSSLKSIKLPKTLIGIADGAFAGTEIEKIDFPTSLENIGESAFTKCQNLKSVVIPENVTYLARRAFSECSGLETLVLPKSIDGIPKELCQRCESLKTVEIKGDITSIGAYAFEGCKSITELTINGPLNNIGECALTGCNSLKAIHTNYSTADSRCIIKDGELHCFAPAGLTEYEIPTGVKAILSMVFYQCNIENITIPEGVLTIGSYAFAENEKLKAITIPSTVRSIDFCALSYCKSLKTLTMKPSTPPAAEISENNTYFEKIIVPKGCGEAYKSTSPWNKFASIILEEE